MFENVTGYTLIAWILSFLFTKYVLPRLLQSDRVQKLVKVVDRSADVLESVPAGFDWSKTEPYPYRPFKPIYHLTMGISKSTCADWLRIENTYLLAVEYKKKIIATEESETCIASQLPDVSPKGIKRVDAAVAELYEYLVDYMRKKFPSTFVTTGSEVTNMITGAVLSRKAPKNATSKELLKLIALNIEEDFLMLEKDDKIGEYVMRATTGVTANGFRNSEKINQKLTDIHGPVPQYVPKLKLSMNRHFERVKAREFTQRLTWGIQTGGGSINSVYRPSGIHNKEGETVVELDGSTMDIGNDCYLRVERQILTRLPKSKFLVLSIRTYMYPLAQLKAEGSGEALATAISGFPDDTAHYKGRSRWGRAVMEYLTGRPVEKGKSFEQVNPAEKDNLVGNVSTDVPITPREATSVSTR